MNRIRLQTWHAIQVYIGLYTGAHFAKSFLNADRIIKTNWSHFLNKNVDYSCTIYCYEIFEKKKQNEI